MIPQTRDEGMPVVQVKVHVLAEPAKGARDLQDMRQGACRRVLDVRDQVGQAVVGRAQLLEVQAGMAVPEPGGRLPQADVADVDAAADPLGVLQPLGHLDEPAAIQPGGVLQENQGPVRALAKAGIQFTHSGQQALGLCSHLTFVMDDQASHPARETVSEFAHHGAVSPVQHVEAAAQVDHRQAGLGGHERQHVVELVRCIGVHLGRHAHLGEPQRGESQQRIVPIDASLEQGVNVPGRHLPRGDTPGPGFAGTLSGTIHDPHPAAVQPISSSLPVRTPVAHPGGAGPGGTKAARGRRSATLTKPSAARGIVRRCRFSCARALS